MKGYTMSLPFASSEHHLDAAELENILLNTEETDMGSLTDGDIIVLHNVLVTVRSRVSNFIWTNTNREVRTIKIAFSDSDGVMEVHTYLADCKIDRIKPIA